MAFLQSRREQFHQRPRAWPARNDIDLTLSTEDDVDVLGNGNRANKQDEYFDEDTVIDASTLKPRTLSSPPKAMRPLANAYEHFSPAIAARHDRMRAQMSKSSANGAQPMSRAALFADNDDTESDSESSSSASSASIMGATAPFHSVAESTGNHNGLVSSPEVRARHGQRPRLNVHALDELDRVSRKGTSQKAGQRIAASSNHNRQSPFKPLSKKAKGHQDADHAETTSRKVSSGSSSNGRKHPGTSGSTSGETLVEREDKYGGSGNMFLPSGQVMGTGIPNKGFDLPDITGMSAALESPVRERLGVQHKAINKQHMEDMHVAAAQVRLGQLNDLASYIKGVEANLGKTQQKVDRIEASSKECIDQVGKWQSNWSSWRDENSRGRRERRATHTAWEATDCEKKIAQMNEHIAQLDFDLKSYRRAMQDDRNLKNRTDVKSHKKEKAPFVSFSSPRKKSAPHAEEEGLSSQEFDALKGQVDTVAREVERLKTAVYQRELTHPDKAASSPIKPSNGMKAFGLRSYGRANPFQACAAEKRRKQAMYTDVEDDLESQSEDASSDEGCKHGQHLHLSEQEADLVAARKRAESALHNISYKDLQHCPAKCTVCNEGHKRERRRLAAKKQSATNLRRQSSSPSVIPLDEKKLFDVLKNCSRGAQRKALASVGLKHGERQDVVLHRLLQEHKDDFYHFRITYGEMADELKKLDPNMHPIDRKILADGVIEMVETLEQCATRINLLQVALEEDELSEEEYETDHHDAEFLSGPASRHCKHRTRARKASFGQSKSRNGHFGTS